MKAPGRERVSEELARHLHGNDRCDEHRGGQPQISRSFQRNESHCQRTADHGHRQRAHADDRVGIGIRMKAHCVKPKANNWPPSAPRRSEAKNKPPRNPEPSEMTEATAYSTKIIVIAASGSLKMPVRCRAP